MTWEYFGILEKTVFTTYNGCLAILAIIWFIDLVRFRHAFSLEGLWCVVMAALHMLTAAKISYVEIFPTLLRVVTAPTVNSLSFVFWIGIFGRHMYLIRKEHARRVRLQQLSR